MPHPTRALYLYCGRTAPTAWMTVAPETRDLAEWTLRGIEAGGSWARVWSVLRLPEDFSRFDLIVTSEYFLGFAVNLRLRWGRAKTRQVRHLIWGMNQSRRLLTQPGLAALARWAFARTDRIVTHSREEIGQFHRIHALAEDRFRFVRWGFDLPTPEPTAFPARQQPYVCLIGRNNRDLKTFALGCQAAGVHGVLISAGLPAQTRQELEALGLECHEDQPFDRCLACMRDALANVVLLQDDSRGAGHITLVGAMHLGKPQIVSRARVIEDYVSAPELALTIPLGDPAALAEALRHLMAQPELAARMGAAATARAKRDFSNQSVAAALRDIVQDLMAAPRAEN